MAKKQAKKSNTGLDFEKYITYLGTKESLRDCEIFNNQINDVLEENNKISAKIRNSRFFTIMRNCIDKYTFAGIDNTDVINTLVRTIYEIGSDIPHIDSPFVAKKLSFINKLGVDYSSTLTSEDVSSYDIQLLTNESDFIEEKLTSELPRELQKANELHELLLFKLSALETMEIIMKWKKGEPQ